MFPQTLFPAPAAALLLASAYCVFLTVLNILGDNAFPDCDHPVKCFDLETELRESLNTSVDPCDDLYDHVCEDFPFTHPFSNQFALLNDRTHLTLLKVLIKPRDAHSTSALDKIALAFQKCIRVLSNEEERSNDVTAILKQYNFKWPALEQEDSFDYLDLSVGLALDYNIPFLFEMTVYPYFRTDKKYSLALSWIQGFINAPNLLVRTMAASDIMQCINAFASVPKRDLGEMANIIIEVFNDVTAVGKHHRYDHAGNYTTFSDMQRFSPSITPSEWINTINKHLPPDVAITGSDDVLVISVALPLLQHILPDYNRKMAHLMLFCGYALIVNLAHTFSYSQLRCAAMFQPKYSSEFTGLCLATVNNLAPFAVARTLFDEILDPFNVNITAHMYRNIRREAQKSFSTLSWMAEASTRQSAVERVGSIVEVEGMPEDLSSHKEIEDFYAYLPSFNRSFIEDYLEANRQQMLKLKGLLKLNATSFPVRRDHIDVNLVEVNAYYLPLVHMLIIPGAILQSPFVSTAIPIPASYGAIGRILGHELSHAFDPVLGTTARTGDILNWYDAKSEAAFKDRVQCLIKQVNEASKSVTLGNNSLSEAFADNAGMEKTILAYKSHAKGSESMLGYTPDELFFISSCFTFCSFSKSGVGKDETYPSAGLRCNLPAGNAEMFSEVFRCREGARMNFKQRCKFNA